MPKGRRGVDVTLPGAGAVPDMPDENVEEMVEMDPQEDIREEPAQEAIPETTRVPVYRDGWESRLSQPLQRANGEVERFNTLWHRFVNDRSSLAPEEYGELHEYLCRRMALPLRNYTQGSRRPETENTLLLRNLQLRTVEHTLGIADTPQSFMARNTNAADTLRRITDNASRQSVDPSDDFTPLSPSELRVFKRLSKQLKDGDALSADELKIGRAQAVRLEREKYRALMEQASGAGSDDPFDLVKAYAEHEDAVNTAKMFDEKYREHTPGAAPIQLFDGTRVQRTIDYMRRIAGPVNFSEQPTGRVFRGRDARNQRLPEPRDVESPPSVALLVPSLRRASRLKENAEALGIAVMEQSDGVLRNFIINWGHNRAPIVNSLNPDVSAASDKAECLKRLGDLAPRTIRDWAQAKNAWDVVVGKQSRGASQGKCKEVLDTTAESSDTRNYRYDLFQEYFPERDEYRVVMLGDKVLTVHSKNSVPGTSPVNLRPEREYVRMEKFPKGALDMAKEAISRAGIDLGGVDLLKDRRTGRWYVLEVNSAPGMGQSTMKRLLEELSERRNRHG